MYIWGNMFTDQPMKPTMTDIQELSATKADQGEVPLLAVEVLKKLRIVIRAAQRHSASIEKQCDVSGAQLWVMHELSESPGLRVGDIASKMSIHQTTASNLLDTLAKKGYVIKQRDSIDQRVVKLTLSEQGLEIIMRAPKPARGLLPDALCKLEHARLTDLNTGLQALVSLVGRETDASGLLPLPFTM